MIGEELKPRQRVEAVVSPRGEQTVPAGTRGWYLGNFPEYPDLHGIEWDKEITVGKGKSHLVFVLRDEFRVVDNEGIK